MRGPAALILAFDRVACVRGGRQLFADVTFELRAGDALVVAGPNGVGKSSLLRLAAGLLSASAGQVHRVGAAALADDQLALDASLPLARALGFWARIDGGREHEALGAVDLAHLSAVPVRMLSTGQRRRASLARVVASNATLWLLDEPGNGLDGTAVAMLEGLIAVHRARGGAVVVATHQPLSIGDAQALVLA